MVLLHKKCSVCKKPVNINMTIENYNNYINGKVNNLTDSELQFLFNDECEECYNNNLYGGRNLFNINNKRVI